MIIGLTPLDKSDVTAYATTWKLATDSTLNNIVMESIKDTENIDSWDINIAVPVGEVWYASAHRHLKDSKGNVLNNDTVIPPIPIYSNESQLTDNLAPKFTISDPYMSVVKYIPGKGMDIKLDPYKSNVKYIKTLIHLEDEYGRELYTGYMDMDKSDTMTIHNYEVNFNAENYIAVFVTHIAAHSTVSATSQVVVIPSKVFYTVQGSTSNLDINAVNKISFIGINKNLLDVSNVTMTDIDKNNIRNCEIKNKEVYIPKGLNFSSEYLINYTLAYYDEKGISQALTDTLVITTGSINEELAIDTNVEYTYTLSKYASKPYMSSNVNSTELFNTEEMFTGVIPMIGKDNKLNSYIKIEPNSDSPLLIKATSDEYNFKGMNCFRLINKTKAVLQYIIDEKIYLSILSYDAYTDKFTLDKTITTEVRSINAAVPSFAIINGNLYLAGVLYSDTYTIAVYKIDIYDYSIKELMHQKMSFSMHQTTVVNYDNNNIWLFPSSPICNTSYLYTIQDEYSDNGLIKNVAMPSTFIETDTIANRLSNGVIAVAKVNDSTCNTDMIFINPDDASIIIKNDNIKSEGVIRNVVSLRNGKLLYSSVNADKVNYYILN